MKINWKLISIAIIIFVSGLILGLFFHKKQPYPTQEALRENSSQYKFINHLLLSDISQKEDLPEYKPLEADIEKYSYNAKSQNLATDISFYFRDLDAGTWTGINEDVLYSPASMLKVATLITYLKASESNPKLLNTDVHVLSWDNDANISEYYKPQDPIEVGKTYSIQDLLEHMIRDSDNNATNLLGSPQLQTLIGANTVTNLYKELELSYTATGTSDYMSPKMYSRFFRVLYNSTLLSHSQSEMTLNLLSQTNFRDGLVAGLPAQTIVAHKFGERTIIDATGNPTGRELHDCGIVYYPEHPYFICVMTRGSDLPNLAKVIKNISQITWSDATKMYTSY